MRNERQFLFHSTGHIIKSFFTVLSIKKHTFLCFFIKLLKNPIKLAFKLLLHAVGGFVMLFLVNFFGSYLGISLEMSWLNAIVSGVLGVPGVVILLLFKYVL